MIEFINNNDLVKLIIDTINNDQKAQFKVIGSSMFPFFHDGITSVYLKKANVYKKYDVCLFLYNDAYYLHRIIKIKKDVIIFQGDALKNKECVNVNQIFGKVIAHETKGVLIDSSSKKYLLKVFIWQILKPVRRILVRLLRRH